MVTPDTYEGNDWVTGPADNGGVHSNSGVQNFWYYLLVNGGTGTNDINNAYSVQGLGLDTAAQIAYRNLSTYLTPTSNYEDARFFGIQSAIDLFGACSYEVEQTTRAWYAVGVGIDWVPTVNSDFYTPDTIGCYIPFTANFTNLSSNGQTFTWDFGDGSSTSSSVAPTHIYTTYGTYSIELIVDGGSCGIDTLERIAHISVDTNNECYVKMGAPDQTACSGTLYDNGGASKITLITIRSN